MSVPPAYEAHAETWSVTVEMYVTGMVEVAPGRRNPIRTPQLTVFCGDGWEAESVGLSPEDAERFAAALIEAAKITREKMPTPAVRP